MSWDNIIKQEQYKPYYRELVRQVYNKGYLNDAPTFPDYENVFRAFALTPHRRPRLVILGQEPYANASANGLAFSSDYGVPPSLRNIYKELQRSFPERGYEFHDGDLTGWARQGILLLNTSLTVGEGVSHAGFWKPFTTRIVQELRGSTFLLLGKQAQKLFREAGGEGEVVEAPHPSPQTKGFIGSGVFEKVEALIGEVDWGGHTRIMLEEPTLNIDPFVIRRKDDSKKTNIQRRLDEELSHINSSDSDFFIYT